MKNYTKEELKEVENIVNNYGYDFRIYSNDNEKCNIYFYVWKDSGYKLTKYDDKYVLINTGYRDEGWKDSAESFLNYEKEIEFKTLNDFSEFLRKKL